MSKCPACGALLELVVGTDYAKAQTILQSKATGTDLTNEQLDVLKWKQSQKRPSLSTILVSETTLGVPIIKLLYDRLTTSANKAWKLGEVTYKLSVTPEGTEFLQRWRPYQIA
jgi:hypothetical protein